MSEQLLNQPKLTKTPSQRAMETIQNSNPDIKITNPSYSNHDRVFVADEKKSTSKSSKKNLVQKLGSLAAATALFLAPHFGDISPTMAKDTTSTNRVEKVQSVTNSDITPSKAQKNIKKFGLDKVNDGLLKAMLEKTKSDAKNPRDIQKLSKELNKSGVINSKGNINFDRAKAVNLRYFGEFDNSDSSESTTTNQSIESKVQAPVKTSPDTESTKTVQNSKNSKTTSNSKPASRTNSSPESKQSPTANNESQNQNTNWLQFILGNLGLISLFGGLTYAAVKKPKSEKNSTNQNPTTQEPNSPPNPNAESSSQPTPNTSENQSTEAPNTPQQPEQQTQTEAPQQPNNPQNPNNTNSSWGFEKTNESGKKENFTVTLPEQEQNQASNPENQSPESNNNDILKNQTILEVLKSGNTPGGKKLSKLDDNGYANVINGLRKGLANQGYSEEDINNLIDTKITPLRDKQIQANLNNQP